MKKIEIIIPDRLFNDVNRIIKKHACRWNDVL